MRHIHILFFILLLTPLLGVAQSIDISKTQGSNYVVIVDQDTLSGTHQFAHTATNRLRDEAVKLGVYDPSQSRTVRTVGSNWIVVADQDTLPNTFIEQYTAIQAMVRAVGDYYLDGSRNIRAYKNEEIRLTNTGSHFIRAVRNEELRLDRLDLYYLDDYIIEIEEVVDTVYIINTVYEQLVKEMNWVHKQNDPNVHYIEVEVEHQADSLHVYLEGCGVRWVNWQTGDSIDCNELVYIFAEATKGNRTVIVRDSVDLEVFNDFFLNENMEGDNQWIFTADNFDETQWSQFWHGSSTLTEDGLYMVLEDTASGSNVWINEVVPYTNQMEVYMVASTAGASPHIRALATPYGYAQDIYYSGSIGGLQYAYWRNADFETPWAQGMYTFQTNILIEGQGDYIHKVLRVEDGMVYVKAWFGDDEPAEWTYTVPVVEGYEEVMGGLGIGAHSPNVRHIEYLSVGINGQTAPRR